MPNGYAWPPIPAARMTDAELAMDLALLGRLWDESRSDLDDEGHGGSPGEWMWERMGEVEAEQKRRKAIPEMKEKKRHDR
jgi:hypothetical protein